MCAVLIIRKLRPRVGAYEEVQRLLADPSQLPIPSRRQKKRFKNCEWELCAGHRRATSCIASHSVGTFPCAGTGRV